MSGLPGTERDRVHLVVLAALVLALGAGGLFAQTKFDRDQNVRRCSRGGSAVRMARSTSSSAT